MLTRDDWSRDYDSFISWVVTGETLFADAMRHELGLQAGAGWRMNDSIAGSDHVWDSVNPATKAVIGYYRGHPGMTFGTDPAVAAIEKGYTVAYHLGFAVSPEFEGTLQLLGEKYPGRFDVRYRPATPDLREA